VQVIVSGSTTIFIKESQVRTLLRIVIVGTALVAWAGQAAAQAADPLIGTWELNVSKSTFNPGPGPRSESRTYVLAGTAITATSRGLDADGKPTAEAWTVNYDGLDHPTTGNPNIDALSLKRIDAFTAEFTEKRAGKVVVTGTRAISQDGKTMTITAKGTNGKGQEFNNVEVFDKR
jgi:hypothetical protein